MKYRPKEGYINKWRRYQKHRFYPTQEKREFMRGEAWEDLLFKAAFKPHATWFKGKEYHLNVGELVTSQRDLASRWKWSRSKVRRYLEDLYEHGEAAHRTDQFAAHTATVVTIYRLAGCEPSKETPRPTPRPTKHATREAVGLEVQECTTLSSNGGDVLTGGILAAWRNRKKKGSKE